MPLIISPCRFRRTHSISQFQSINDPSKPLISLSRGEAEEILQRMADDIEKELESLPKPGPHGDVTSGLANRRTAAPYAASSLQPSDLSSEQAAQFLHLLQQGVGEWNRWRKFNANIDPCIAGLQLSDLDLSGIDFRRVDLSHANLSASSLQRANLRDANLEGAYLVEADLSDADLTRANLAGANLGRADLSGADANNASLRNTVLRRADLSNASMREADLQGADLEGAILLFTNLERANLSNSHVHGVAAWNVRLVGSNQSNLIITPSNEPIITVDDLEMAQIFYSLIFAEKLQGFITAIVSKGVLILGRFTPERKAVLDGLREALRSRGYLPILFDFEKPASRDLTETISTLAHMSRFIIADLTDAKSIPQELQRIVPGLPSVPVQPLLLSSEREYAMFELLRRYPWVLPIHLYASQVELLQNLEEKVIAPAEAKVREQAPR